MQIDLVTIGQVAGYLEGEGSFDVGTRRISFGATDEDVVQHIAKILEGRVRTRQQTSGLAKNPKLMYYCTVPVRTSVQWMMTIYTLMGERRKVVINAALASWKNPKKAGRPRKIGGGSHSG